MLESRITQPPGRRKPMVLAVFSYRHDAHLVPGMLANIAPFTHGYIGWDDRATREALSSEPERRNRLLAEARRMGADWVLAIDPDERFEDQLAARMPEMLAAGAGNLWHFVLREMFSPSAYRADGVWGAKTLLRLMPIAAVCKELAVPLHAAWVADGNGFSHRQSRINLYHLRMATPERRAARRALYSAADPERRFQRLGYDYLDDERGMVLHPIPNGRGYSPPFTEDHGLWAPAPDAVGPARPDPMEARLTYVAQSAAKAGHAAALVVMRELCAASPADADLPHVAASLALQSGHLVEAEATANALLARDGTDLHARALRARARLQLGQKQAAASDIAVLEHAQPGSPLVAALAAERDRDLADFCAPSAVWRRWAGGTAHCLEGAGVAHADMAVVVLGLGAPPELAEAVASLLAQEVAGEIVVVNSGGGAPEAVLAAYLDRIRLIAIDAPLRVGAARNIGIDASRAPLIAFLAADCLAAPGWISGRLARHRAGAAMVSTPVLPIPDARLVARAASLLKYWVRNPATAEADISHFGRSYARWIFDEVGPFPPGLRVSEDGALNLLADRLAQPVWAPDVGTCHRDPEGLWALLADHRARGRRRADHPPFRALAGAPDAAARLAADMAARQAGAARAVDATPGLSQPARWAMKAVQALAVGADRRAVAARLRQLAAADTAMPREARGQDARAQARDAFAADGEDWQKAFALGEAEAAAGDWAAAEDAYRSALALAPKMPAPLAALQARVAAASGPKAALAEAEAAALAAPVIAAHWSIAAAAAEAAGQPAVALAHARRALCAAPASPAAHQTLSRLHDAQGNALMAAFRRLARDRLQAAATRTP